MDERSASAALALRRFCAARNRVIAVAVMATVTVALPNHCLAIAISPGAEVGLGATANAVVRVSTPSPNGSGTVIGIENHSGARWIAILTADHVIRNAAGGGTNLFAPNQITVSFGNQGAGGPSFTALQTATLVSMPDSLVDLAVIKIRVPNSKVNTLPAPLAPVMLPGAAPAAGVAIVQAGYGRRASVVLEDFDELYVSELFVQDHLPGTLKAGPNKVGQGGVMDIEVAPADTPFNFGYEFKGLQNDFDIAGAAPNYADSTSYIFPGDSGGPSLVGNTIVGVHSFAELESTRNSTVAVAGVNMWHDVSVFDYRDWINQQVDMLSVPEPSTWVMALVAMAMGVLVYRRHPHHVGRTRPQR